MILDQLEELGFRYMRQAIERQMAAGSHTKHSFEERLSDLVQYERVQRDDRRLKDRVRKAGLSQTARLEELDSVSARGIDRSTLEFLGQETWLEERRNVAVTGATGVGKTFVACALAHRACEFGRSARFFRLPRLLAELEIARADGTYTNRLASLARIDVLVLDDWGLAPLDPTPGEISSRFSTTDTKRDPPSSPDNCPSRTGTTGLQTQLWPMPSSTESSTTPTG